MNSTELLNEIKNQLELLKHKGYDKNSFKSGYLLGYAKAFQLKQTDVKQYVCNYCLEFVDELPDKFGCKDCIEKYTKQTDSFFCTKTQNNEPKCKTECNFCKDMQKEYKELKNDL